MMEIKEEHILDLVRGQATITQAVSDLTKRIDTAIPYLIDADKELEDKIGRVEKKLWYFGGAGTVLGYIGSHFFEKWFNLGGK